MKKTSLFVCSGLLAFAGPLVAATQGTASTTSSTGSFTATAQGPATPRTVQVLNISDMIITNSTHPEDASYFVGATMPFCVVDTYGMAVRLSLTTGNPLGTGNQWQLKSTGGSAVTYELRLSYADGSGLTWPGTGSTTMSNDFPAGKAATSTGECGSGHLKAHLRITTVSGLLPETYPALDYTDTITMVLTPQ